MSFTGDPNVYVQQLGPLQTTWFGMLAILSLASLIFIWFGFLSPLRDRAPGRTVGIITALFSAVFIAILQWRSVEALLWMDAAQMVLYLAGAAAAGIAVYGIVAAWLRVEDATGWSTNRGFILQKDTKAVLNGTYSGNDARRKLPNPPPNWREYFRYSGNSEPFIWTNGSRNLSSALVSVLYFLAVFCLVSAIGLQSIIMTRGPITIAIPDVVSFATGKAEVTPDGEVTLDGVASTIDRYGARTVTVRGYADSRGSDVNNQRLSEDRARAVVAHLRSRYPGARYVELGMGESQSNADEAGLGPNAQKLAQDWNRRVEFELIP